MSLALNGKLKQSLDKRSIAIKLFLSVAFRTIEDCFKTEEGKH
jgi:hypothetical protein